MTDGLYSVLFSGPGGSSGSGVAAVRNGAINGGDAAFGYLGRFTTAGAAVDASIRVIQHRAGMPSVFGSLNNFTLTMSGTTEGVAFTLSGSVSNQPGLAITVRGRRFADLA